MATGTNTKFISLEDLERYTFRLKEVLADIKGDFLNFKGYIGTTPPQTAKVGRLFYESSTLPTTFPINVKTWDGTEWSSTTTEYTPDELDLWADLNSSHGYYWFNNEWNLLDQSTVEVDETTITKNLSGELEVKDSGITKSKLNSNVADNSTIELDSTDGLQVKDEGITKSKLNSDVADGSTIELDSTNGLQIKDIGVTKSKLNSNVVDNSTLELDTTNGLQIKDNGITFPKLKSDLYKTSLANDYYFAWKDIDANKLYTKSIQDAASISAYRITVQSGKVTTITEVTGAKIEDGVLKSNSVDYNRNIPLDGFYVVNDTEKLITISALADIMDKAGKVNDVKVANKSQVKDKVATIQTIDNLESNFYYGFKNGSNYFYTKSKATGTTAYYQFTYTDSKLTKIENKGNVTISLNASTLIPQFTVSSTTYTYDKTKENYYIIDPEQKLPSMVEQTQALTDTDMKRIFEDFYIMPPNTGWKYVGNLSSDNGSSLTVGDDWSELLVIMRVQEGSYFYNLTNVIPKYGFTYGNPTSLSTFAGFYWSASYNCSIRLSLQGTGVNRKLVQSFKTSSGWSLSVSFIFKR